MSSSLSEPRRPRLAAHNRKLRHLKGLSLRNLCSAPAGRRAAAALHPSRSSDCLRADTRRPPAAAAPVAEPPPRRPGLSPAHAPAASRQRRLDALVDASVGDAFFSLHVAGDDGDPVYVSEVRRRSANFNFHFFDLADRPPSVSRACRVAVRVWARRRSQPAWVFVLDELVDLRRLNFIGSLVDRRFPPNALVFHLDDGLYSLDLASCAAEPRQAAPAATSSYSALMRLATLEGSVGDAVDTRRDLAAQADALLARPPPAAADAAADAVARARRYVAAQRRANRAAETRRDGLRASLAGRRAAIARGRDAQARAADAVAGSRPRLDAARALVAHTERQIAGQRRRICADLAAIFPISPVPGAPPLSFGICGLPLPNSTYDAATARAVNEDVLSAALGLVALLTRHLQFYLGRPLPYPLCAYGSRSLARDDISHLPARPPTRRQFPLYLPRGGSAHGQWRLEYGWFLVNKDIEALCASQGLRVVDIRHSLPNLKYLLYVCSAGDRDVPDRKRGGVRGLCAGSRRAAADRPADTPAAASPAANGAVALPFAAAEAKFTLRTRGLREDVAG